MLAAQSINLSSDQIACIGEAFDAAGIYAETRDFDFIVGPGSTLTVLDKNGNPYADYVCHINGTLSRRTELEDRSYTQSFLDNTEAPLPLPLQEGSYAIRLYDKTDAPQPINFTLKIDPAKAAEEIKIGTNYQAAADSPSFTAEDLLDGYWENNIQCPQVYQFKSDGTVDVYYPNARSTIVRPDELEYSRSMHYEYDGKVLAFTGENGSRTELELVTIDDTIAFDEGLALDAIPSGVPFFYETGWVHDPNADSDNALYLVKVDEFRIVTDPNSIYDGDSITLAGTLTDETVQTDLCGAEKAYVLVLDEPIEKNLYYDAGGFLGERVTLDRVLVGFNYRESYLRSEFLGKHITINGTAAYPDRDQYISPFLVTYALAEISEDPSHNSPTNDNPDIYTTFLQDQLYADYYYDKIQIWDDDSRNIQIRYAIYDINADGIQELLIYRWEMEFGDLMVFTQDSSGHVAYAGTLGMYLSPSYSPANNSLVYLYMRPSANGSPWDKDYDYEFVQLRGQSLVSLGHAIYNSGKEKWTSVDSGISVNEETDDNISFCELP